MEVTSELGTDLGDGHQVGEQGSVDGYEVGPAAAGEGGFDLWPVVWSPDERRDAGGGERRVAAPENGPTPSVASFAADSPALTTSSGGRGNG